jgi:hypothetical protein
VHLLIFCDEPLNGFVSKPQLLFPGWNSGNAASVGKLAKFAGRDADSFGGKFQAFQEGFASSGAVAGEAFNKV